MKPHARRIARAMIARSRKRVANQMIAQVATVDRNALDRLGIRMGTARDGKVLMSRVDWARAQAAGAVTLA